MAEDIRMSKLIYRNILCQKADWVADLSSLEAAIDVPDYSEDERKNCKKMIETLKRDIAYLDALLAVEYPFDASDEN